MVQGHRSPYRSDRAKRNVVGSAGGTAERSEGFSHPGKVAENEEESGIAGFGNTTSGTQTDSSTMAGQAPAKEDLRVVADLVAKSVLVEVREDPAGQQATATAANAPEAAPLTHPDSPQVPLRDDESPIWIKAVELFEKEKLEEYGLIVGQIAKIQELKDGGTWGTWLDAPGLGLAAKETKCKWLRTCKAYMPSLGTVKGIAQSLSDLDPHKVAPLVTTGVFLLVELCFGIWDPEARDKVMGFLLKTNIFISKSASREGELKRMKMNSMQEVKQKVGLIEERLCKLYLDSLALISEIHKDGRTRYSRSKASLISGPSEWGRAYEQIQDGDSELGELKSQVELILKAIETNSETLDWIWSRQEDPEPLHQTVNERTGVQNTSSMVGNWFLETSAFTSWVAGIRENTAENLVFWVKGSTMQLYQSAKSNPEAQVTMKKAWEPLLKELIASSSTAIVLVLDALDECKLLDDYMTLLEFLSNLPRGPNGPYLLLSSQPHVPVRSYFGGSVQTFDVVQPEPRNDMKNFIDDQIASKSKQVRWEKSVFFKDAALLDELKAALLESAGGMLRWVEIWLGVFFPRNSNAVKREVNAKTLLNKLKKLESLRDLPHDKIDESRHDRDKMAIRDAYEKLWYVNGDYGQDKDLQVRLFQIMTAAFENLTPQAVHEAVCFNPSKPEHYEELEHDHIERLYSSFLKVNEEGRLEYEHLSAKKFVDKIRDAGKATFSIKESHRTMADVAMCALERPDHPIWINAGIDLVGWGASAAASVRSSYLTTKPWHGPIEFKLRPPNLLRFGAYLFRFWLRHCQTLHGENSFIQRMGKFFQSAHPGFEGWVICQAERYGSGSRGIDAIYHNTITYMEGQENEALKPNPFLSMVSFGFSPVSHNTDQPALLSGFEDATVRNLSYKTALHVACEASNITMVKDLLELECCRQGSCPSLLTTEDNCGRIPLHLARDDEVVKILLEYEIRGSPISSTTRDPRRSQKLHWVDKGGEILMRNKIWVGCSDSLVKWILQEYIVEPWTLYYLYRTAVNLGNLKTFKYLVERGADPDVKVGDGHTPALSIAMSTDNLPLATLLLDHGATFDNSEVLGETLNRAVKSGNPEMLHLLVNKGAIIDIKGLHGTTALYETVRRQRLDIVEYLLSQRADACAPQGQFAHTILQVTAATGSTKTMGLLLDYGADINAAGRPEDHETPSLKRILAEHPKFGTLPFLETPLKVAVKAQREDMVEFLRENQPKLGHSASRVSSPSFRPSFVVTQLFYSA
ncbi:hypothetical protein INS49_005495 [Diaporthe citri]|uniref:uncharacterized protein n=1 Tax=Diaporthe citri TaxID=83186 RepID=UPI001C7ED0B7|nr:uncharacterized protein INS49_005495 [Diaporthe citri]KAG6353533.1 hypothetical protein INS49_005495 [Diaporthe citri]